MRKFKNIVKGFTLVELIIVITILAILATIGFVSFQGYTKDARDGNRLASIQAIEKGINLYQVKTSSYPNPENSLTVLSSGSAIGYQGFFGNNNSRVTNLSSTPLDPLDNTNYTYITNINQDGYQIVGFFENSSHIGFENNIISKTYAGNVDYSLRIVKSFGKELGALLINTGSDINRPLHELYSASSFTGIDIKLFTGTLSNGTNIGNIKAVFNNKSGDNIVGTGSSLGKLENSYKQKIQLIMTNCPSGWSDLGTIGGTVPAGLGTNSVTFKLGSNNQNYKICEGNSFSSSSQVLMTNCPSGWNDLGTIGGTVPAGLGTSNVTFKLGSNNQNYKICEGNSFSSSSQVLMTNCPNGWSDLGTIGGTVPAGLGTNNVTFKLGSNNQTYTVCQKN